MTHVCSDLIKRTANQPVVVLTRPAGQAQDLAQMLLTHELQRFDFPLIKLQAIEHDAVLNAVLKARLASLERYALVVFVSPNAIEHALARLSKPWPAEVAIGVVGPGSARALARYCISAPAYKVISPPLASSSSPDSPPRYDSEALVDALDQALGLASLKGQRVLIVRGNGGRPWLKNCLQSHGAIVSTVTAYQRVLPEPTSVQWQQVHALLAGKRHAWLITSSESIRNLCALARTHLNSEQQALLKRAQLVVTHQRIAESAHALGFDTIMQTGVGDESIIQALLSCFP